MYVAPVQGDLRKKGDLSALLDKAPPRVADDYCGRARAGDRHDLGALEHSLGECHTTTPPLVDGGVVAPVPDAGGAGAGFDAGAGSAPEGGGGGCTVGASRGGGAGLLFAVALALLRRRSR
jgi:hypothetical protein